MTVPSGDQSVTNSQSSNQSVMNAQSNYHSASMLLASQSLNQSAMSVVREDTEHNYAAIEECTEARRDCEICGKNCADLHQLKFHLATVHYIGDIDSLECYICSKVFSQRSTLKRHLAILHGLGDVKHFPCRLCSKVCTEKSNLKKHMKRIHGMRSVPPHMLSSDQSATSAEPVKLSAESAAPIEQSVVRVSALNTASKRSRPVHRDAKHACEVCDRKFTQAYILRRHLRYVHGVESVRRMTARRDRAHASSSIRTPGLSRPEHRDAKYPCEVCGRKFICMNHKRRHLATVHRGKNRGRSRPEHPDAKYPCEICGRKFLNMNHKRRHLAEVHGEKNKAHASSNSRAPPPRPEHLNAKYPCDVCGKKFTLSGNMQKHRKSVHGVGGVETFKCEVCLKVFKRKADLKTHLSSIHSLGDVKRFHCSFCSKVFTQRGSLRCHKRRVHGQADK